MKRIRVIKELKSPTRDLPEGVVLKVGVDLSTSLAGELVRDGYAEDADKEPAPEVTVLVAEPVPEKPPEPAPASRLRKRRKQ